MAALAADSMEIVDPTMEAVVIDALKADKHLWRTIRGIRKSTQIQYESDIEDVLDSLIRKGLVIRGTDNRTGRNIYSLWSRYRAEESFLQQGLDGLSGSFSA